MQKTSLMDLLNKSSGTAASAYESKERDVCFDTARWQRLSPESSATGMGQFPICKLKWDFLRTSVTACINDKNVFSAPFGIFYVRTEI